MNIASRPTAPSASPPIGVRGRLRALLVGLAALLACSLYIGWSSVAERRADAALAERVHQTLADMDQVLAGQQALAVLRRGLVLRFSAVPEGGDDSLPLAESAAELLAEFRRGIQPLRERQPESGALLDRVGQQFHDAALDIGALIDRGERDAARRRMAEFPRIGNTAETHLRELAVHLQTEQREAHAVREADRHTAQRLAAAALILLALVVLGAVLLVSRSVLPPLNRIHAALAQMARGEPLTEPPVRGEHEFGQIGQALLDLSRLNTDLRDIAFIDSLTRLPNRASFEADFQTRIGRSESCALVLADLDQFRTINDGFGHHFGDEFLCAASQRLCRLLPDTGVYRYSADMFVLLLPTPSDNTRAGLQAELERVRQGMAEVGPVQGRQLTLCCSFGVALFPDDGQDLETLVSAADAAMFQAKRQGRNSVQFTRSNFALQARRRLETADELRVALREGQITPYFQPIIDLAAGEIVCAEALARWRHPVRGFVPPDEFIGVAEDSGQIDALTDHLLRGACVAAAAWHAAGIRRRLAFNLSAKQVRPGVVEMIAKVLHDTGLPAEKLEVEITESAIIERPELAERLLRDLRGIGVAVALDDFGTGYSSLSYLLRFPIDKIKVDRSFVSQLEGQRQAAKIVAATIALASSLEITLVAEGVERLGQMLTLYELGCRQQQGWLFAKALPGPEFDRWALTAPLRLDAVVRSQMDASNDEPAASAA